MNPVEAIGVRTMSKIKWRLIPFVLILYIINYIDRSNIGFAALTMNKELAISASAFGALSAVFFVPYFFCEVPSNLLLHRYGARKWIARIMVTWGIVTTLAMFAQNYWHIYAVRFFLGMMEAGFFPGILFYFTLWFPQKERAKVVALFMLAMPASNFIAAPISGWILDSIHWLGLGGWRWLFFWEGVPAVILGIITWFFLTNSPDEAKWLTAEEKKWLITKLEQENTTKSGGGTRHVKFMEMFSDLRVWRIGIIYMVFAMASNALMMWNAIIIKDFAQVSNTTVGFLSMVPSLFGMIAMPLWAMHSDKTGERKYHVIIAISVATIGALLTVFGPNPTVKLIGLVINSIGSLSALGPFWTIPTLFLAGASAAIGTAVINSCNSLGGFFTGYITGYLKGAFGSNGVLLFVCLCYIVGMVILATMPLKKEEGQQVKSMNSASN